MSEITDERGTRIDYVVAGQGRPRSCCTARTPPATRRCPSSQPLLARRGMRGIHPDLPGMGSSTRTSASSAADVLGALDALLAAEVGDEPFVVIGHSFGAHLARGIAARHPGRVAGIAPRLALRARPRAGTRARRRGRRGAETIWATASATRTSATSRCGRRRRESASSASSGRRSGDTTQPLSSGIMTDRRDGPGSRRRAVRRADRDPRRPRRRARRAGARSGH